MILNNTNLTYLPYLTINEKLEWKLMNSSVLQTICWTFLARNGCAIVKDVPLLRNNSDIIESFNTQCILFCYILHTSGGFPQDFPEVGAPTLGWGATYNFPQNCMKLKEFGPRGRVQNCSIVDPPLHTSHIPWKNCN